MSTAATRYSVQAQRSLQQWNRALFWLACGGIALTIFHVAVAMFGGQLAVAFHTRSGIQVLTEKELVFAQRAVVVGILSLPLACWTFCFSHIIRLSNCISRGEFLSRSAARCLEYFSYGLFAMGIFEVLCEPLVIVYLRQIDKLNPVESSWRQVLSGDCLSTFAAAVLVIIIARIFGVGIQLREDVELTI